MTAVLFSYPRSGNSWIRYCIEVTSGKPTSESKHKVNNYVINNTDEKPILVKRHYIKDIDEWKNYKLLLLIRNPKEAILKHIIDKEKCEQMINKEIISYMHCLDMYDKWGDNKCFFYYEDFISEPKHYIPLILNELKIKYTNDFFENYDDHVQKSINLYTVGPNNSATKGRNDFSYHQKRHPEFAKMIEEKIKANYSINLLERYI